MKQQGRRRRQPGERKREQRHCWWYSQGRLAGPGQTHRVSVFSPTSQLSWLAWLVTDSWQTPSRHSIQTDSLVCEQPNSGAAKREQKECQAAGTRGTHCILLTGKTPPNLPLDRSSGVFSHPEIMQGRSGALPLPPSKSSSLTPGNEAL